MQAPVYNCTQERRGNLCTGRLSWAIDSVCNCTESKIRAAVVDRLCLPIRFPAISFFLSHEGCAPPFAPFSVLATRVSTLWRRQ